MKKRVLAALLCVAMTATMLVGCGSTPKEDKTADKTTNESSKDEGKDVEAVDQKTVYVTPEWLNSAMNGNQKGYEDVVVAEVGYGDVKDCVSYNEGHVPGAIYVDNCEVEDSTGSKEGNTIFWQQKKWRNSCLHMELQKIQKLCFMVRM